VSKPDLTESSRHFVSPQLEMSHTRLASQSPETRDGEPYVQRIYDRRWSAASDKKA
jgi:hypothetical protein